jgi:acyl CoA:acetate/3-ketoacid CoA transferase beta subunit
MSLGELMQIDSERVLVLSSGSQPVTRTPAAVSFVHRAFFSIS